MRTRPLLTGALVLLAAAPAGRVVRSATLPAAAPAGGGSLTLVLGPDGSVRVWKAGDASLSPLPASLSRLAGHPVNDLAAADDGGKVVALPVASPRTGTRRSRLEGSAIVISSPTAAAPPAILNEIPFEGDGRRVVVSRDGRSAYILALSNGNPPGGDLRARLLALDLEEGKVLATTQLDRPPGALALDPDGTRLFLSYAGTIQTYTTRPLAQSWHYRSPGANRGLAFRPGTGVLYSARLNQIARFEPDAIARRKPEERQKRQDDATAVFPLPIAADSLLFSRDGGLLAAYGPGNEIAFVEPVTGTVAAISSGDTGEKTAQGIRPFCFGAGPGELVVASYPGMEVRSLIAPAALHPAAAPRSPGPSPTPTSPAAAPAPAPDRADSGPGGTATPPAANPPPGSAPAPLPEPSPAPSASPAPASAPVQPEEGAAPASLSGRLTGQVGVVGAIVVYGPGSIVREQARAVPDADGAWRVPLPSPGVYRIVPLGKGARPLRAEPNFRTLEVRDEGASGLDFQILGTS